MDRYLKPYLKNNFDFRALKKAGFFSKDIKSTDYEKQAERICEYFVFKNIYEWSLSKQVQFIRPIGVVTGIIKNEFGNDILEIIEDSHLK